MGILWAVSSDVVVMVAGAESTHFDRRTSGEAFHIAAGDLLSQFS